MEVEPEVQAYTPLLLGLIQYEKKEKVMICGLFFILGSRICGFTISNIAEFLYFAETWFTC